MHARNFSSTCSSVLSKKKAKFDFDSFLDIFSKSLKIIKIFPYAIYICKSLYLFFFQFEYLIDIKTYLSNYQKQQNYFLF